MTSCPVCTIEALETAGTILPVSCSWQMTQFLGLPKDSRLPRRTITRVLFIYFYHIDNCKDCPELIITFEYGGGFQIFSDGFRWYSFHCYLCMFALGPKMGGAHILLASGAVASAGAQWLGLSCGLTTSSSPPPPGRCHLWQHHCHRHCSGSPNLNPVVVSQTSKFQITCSPTLPRGGSL